MLEIFALSSVDLSSLEQTQSYSMAYPALIIFALPKAFVSFSSCSCTSNGIDVDKPLIYTLLESVASGSIINFWGLQPNFSVLSSIHKQYLGPLANTRPKHTGVLFMFAFINVYTASFVYVHLQHVFKVTRFSTLQKPRLVATPLFLLAAGQQAEAFSSLGEVPVLNRFKLAPCVLNKLYAQSLLLSLSLSNASEHSPMRHTLLADAPVVNTIVLVLIASNCSSFISNPSEARFICLTKAFIIWILCVVSVCILNSLYNLLSSCSLNELVGSRLLTFSSCAANATRSEMLPIIPPKQHNSQINCDLLIPPIEGLHESFPMLRSADITIVLEHILEAIEAASKPACPQPITTMS
ncbi:MAG: hypothetical protein AAI902_00415 [Candidatus Hodgkinia cicadicola]